MKQDKINHLLIGCGVAFIVGRLSEPRFLIRAESGKVITCVTLDGEDVTDLLYGGNLDLAPVYKDQVIAVTTEDAPSASENTYTITGKVTLNGQPLADVNLELRSPLKAAKTDKNGQFVFEDAATGKLSLTALTDGKVIGYLSFELKEDSKTDVLLLGDGTYTISVDKNSAGMELHLALDEEKGTLVPANVKAVPKVEAIAPQTEDAGFCWWWLLLLLLIVCIVVLEIYRRKKKAN
jgi:hypothetical protein